MKLKVFSILITVCSFSIFHAFAADAPPEIKIGIIAKRGSAKVLEQWRPLADLLSRKLGASFKIEPLEYAEIESGLKSGQLHFLLANPAIQARFEEKYGLTALLTMVNRKDHMPIKEFGGVVFVRRDSPVRDFRDIKGKKLMCVDYSSFGGAVAGWRLLLENSVDPRRDCSAFLQSGGGQDNVVLAVQKGEADAGLVRTGILESMQEEGLIRMEDFTVLHPVKDGFPFVHSTRLYPEWAFSRCAGTEVQLAKNVAKTLMLLDPGNPALVAAKVYRWTYPANYESVAECLRIVGFK